MGLSLEQNAWNYRQWRLLVCFRRPGSACKTLPAVIVDMSGPLGNNLCVCLLPGTPFAIRLKKRLKSIYPHAVLPFAVYMHKELVVNTIVDDLPER